MYEYKQVKTTGGNNSSSPTGSMAFIFSRGPSRKGPCIFIFGLLFLLALYQLGIICSVPKEPTAIMVAKDVSLFIRFEEEVFYF